MPGWAASAATRPAIQQGETAGDGRPNRTRRASGCGRWPGHEVKAGAGLIGAAGLGDWGRRFNSGRPDHSISAVQRPMSQPARAATPGRGSPGSQPGRRFAGQSARVDGLSRGAQGRTHPAHRHSKERQRRVRRYRSHRRTPPAVGGPPAEGVRASDLNGPGSSQPGPFVARSISKNVCRPQTLHRLGRRLDSIYSSRATTPESPSRLRGRGRDQAVGAARSQGRSPARLGGRRARNNSRPPKYATYHDGATWKQANAPGRGSDRGRPRSLAPLLR